LGKNIQAYHENLINAYDSDIGDGTRIGSFSEIGGAVIGKDCVISAYVFICPSCKIGDRVFLGPGTKLLNDLYPSIKGDDFVPNGVTIEDDVVIGGCCTILPGVTIGKGARVAAGAVVTKNVPPNTTVIGFPAQERDDVWQPIDVALDIRNQILGPSRPTAKDIWHDNEGVYGPITQEEILQNNATLDVEKLKRCAGIVPPSPLAGKQHNIDPDPALSNDHPYSKLFKREKFNKEHGHLSTGSPYVKTTFKKDTCNCDVPCDGCSDDLDELPPAIDVTEWVGRADEPVFCRELPEGFDWEKAGVPRITAERLRALIDADEELILSKTKAHKKHRIPDRLPLEEESIGLGLGYWKDGQPREKK
jgi:acetyltransferase-like isoleucine patch superfamily enzyme